jgi:hypothetical protein
MSSLFSITGGERIVKSRPKGTGWEVGSNDRLGQLACLPRESYDRLYRESCCSGWGYSCLGPLGRRAANVGAFERKLHCTS